MFDAIRKVIELTAQISEKYNLSDWRQKSYNVRQVKRAMRSAQQKKRSSSKRELQKAKQEKAIQEAHQELLTLSESFLDKSAKSIAKITSSHNFQPSDLVLIKSIKCFAEHAARQINQVERRVLHGEIIPHSEKVFSIFQPHTEWICKGKAGVPVELGLKVCILEDRHQFILHHKVMEKETDDDVTIVMITETKEAFPNLKSCSFDKGFHSVRNQKELAEELEVPAMKRKGKLSKQVKEIENSELFKQAHHKHSAVESAINALEVHGLDKCLDHGIEGFKRYCALAVLTRNIHRIGDILHKREIAKIKREKKRLRKKTPPI